MRALGLGWILFLISCSSCGSDEAKNPASSSSSSSSSGAGAGATTPDEGLLPSTSVWRTKTEWYRVIENAPKAESSDEMMGNVKTWGKNDVFHIDFSFNVLDATGGTPTTFPPNDEGDSVAVPVPAKGYVEGDHAYTDCPVPDEDCHMLIVDRAANRLYELYQVRKNAAAWEGYLAMWKLDKAYPRENRGAGCTSADAAGMAITPGLIGYRETRKGEIRHALRAILQNDYIRGKAGDKTVPNNVYPGSHGSTAGNAATGVPYGARLRLKTAIADNDPRLKSPGAKALANALRVYGMILSDGGNLPLVAESAKVAHDADASATWEGLLGPRDLDFLRPSDFEIIAIPKADPSQPDAGWYQTKADYNAQLHKPLGCNGIVQP